MAQSTSALEKRVTELENQLKSIVSARPGRKTRPILVSEPGVCGLTPTIVVKGKEVPFDSATCEEASIYRYQKGCKGIACSAKNRSYYADYRQKNKGDVEVE